MASWYACTTDTRTYKWVLPVPNDHAQLYQILKIASDHRKRTLGLPEDADGYDDDLMVDVGDAEVIVYYTVNQDTK